jgi:hypothetical protein
VLRDFLGEIEVCASCEELEHRGVC